MAAKCISINIPPALTAAQTTLSGVTDKMAALSGESCNVFGLLGLKDVEKGIQGILGAVGSAMSAVNDAIAQVQNILNNVFDTAVKTINTILKGIQDAIDQVAAFATSVISEITSQIDDAINLLAERAGISEILACAGTLAQVGLLPPNVTPTLNKLNGFLSSDTPVKDIANQMIADAKNSLNSTVKNTVDGFVADIGNQINAAQDIIEVNVAQLGQYSCAI